jgi:hypothetical protein
MTLKRYGSGSLGQVDTVYDNSIETNMSQRCCIFTFSIPIRIMQDADVSLLPHDVCKLGLLYSEIAYIFIELLVYTFMVQHARKQIAVAR